MDSVSELRFATGLLFLVYFMGLFCICVTAHIEYENLKCNLNFIDGIGIVARS
jgi:hypothetical protein